LTGRQRDCPACMALTELAKAGALFSPMGPYPMAPRAHG
jgi:hypothetical protein